MLAHCLLKRLYKLMIVIQKEKKDTLMSKQYWHQNSFYFDKAGRSIITDKKQFFYSPTIEKDTSNQHPNFFFTVQSINQSINWSTKKNQWIDRSIRSSKHASNHGIYQSFNQSIIQVVIHCIIQSINKSINK